MRTSLPSRAFLGVLAIGLLSSPAWTQGYVEGEVLVRFRPGADRPAQERAAALVQGEIVKREFVLDYAKLELRVGASVEQAVARLEDDPAVVWAEPNYLREALDCTNSPQDPYLLDNTNAVATRGQWGVFQTGVYSLWRHLAPTDTTVRIGVIDSGINNYASPHPSIAANVLNGANDGFDYVQDDNDPTDQGPWKGHGTAVAGVLAAVANNQGIVGIAPCAELIFVRTLDCNLENCEGNVEDTASAIKFAADKNCDVINLSLGGLQYSKLERDAVLYAIGKGAIVVAASGNDTADSLRFPARFPEVIAVGASTPTDGVASFSNYGPTLDVVAPGDEIWTCSADTAYAAVDGTSFATPFVAGVCGLLRARFPEMKAHEAEAWLRARTVATSDPTKDGHGRVDFPRLEDASDVAAYGETQHENHFWEWLGEDVTHEAYSDDPADDDGVPNSVVDGGNDGMFPRSFSELPLMPYHLGGADTLKVLVSTSRHDGPRYGGEASKQLYLNSWFDWGSDNSFHFAYDRELTAEAINPQDWSGDSMEVGVTILPLDEHILGNPLTVRTRLHYSNVEPVTTPEGFSDYGEVEDTRFINFVEEFDMGLREFSPIPPYMTMNGWGVVPDPQPLWTHHGRWEFASSPHPISPACDFNPSPPNPMISPVMDWTEYSKAFVKFDYCHAVFPCPGGGGPDLCRFELRIGPTLAFSTPIPGGSGTMSFDFTSFVGVPGVTAHVVMETDKPGVLFVDDIRIWAYDDSKPAALTDLVASRQPGGNAVRLQWSDPNENTAPIPPGANPRASTYMLRFAKDPIATLADWDLASRLLRRDAPGGFPVPAPGPGAVDASFDVPSAHQTYHVAVRTGDEVTNLSPIGGNTQESTIPDLALSVVGGPDQAVSPGQMVMLEFELANNGTVKESIRIDATDTQLWVDGFQDMGQVSSPTWRLLDYGTSEVLQVWVGVTGNGGDTDTVTVVATALSSEGTVTDSDQVVLTVSGTSAVAQNGLPSKASLRLVGSNPSRGAVIMRAALPRAGEATLDVYNAVGARVRSVARRTFAAGLHDLTWDGADDAGREMPSGVYAARLRVGDEQRAVRIVRVR